MNQIMIGCPVSNREWVLPEYLNSIKNLDYPKNKIHLAFLVNGEECDQTLLNLMRFKTENEPYYVRIDIWKLSGDHKDSRSHGRISYSKFANIRNTWLSMRDKDDEYVFSVDSDVLIPSNTLTRLLSHDKDIISAAVYNGEFYGEKFYNILEKGSNGTYHTLYPNDDVIEVDATGACILISKDVLDKNTHYGHHSQGEDMFFCEKAKENGFKIYSDTQINTKHKMERPKMEYLECKRCHFQWEGNFEEQRECPECHSRTFFIQSRMRIEL